MKKSDAKNLFGGTFEKLAKAVNRGKSAISQWPEELTEDQINLVVGAAVRRGVKVPDQYLRYSGSSPGL